MPTGLNPSDLLRRDREAAARLSEKVGKKRALEVLRGAAQDLEKRLRHAESIFGPGRGSFTAVHARATLLQVRAVLRTMEPGLKGAVVKTSDEAAVRAARDDARYLRVAEAHFSGSTQRLRLDEAALFDAATAGSKASVLRRLVGEGGPKARGILERYGEATVGHFERILQKQVVARKPAHEVREELIAASPFLKQAPAYWAERIVRTESQHGSNQASFQAIQEADDQLGDMVKILMCVNDARTGADSLAVHGQIRRVQESFDTWYGPCIHPPDRPNDRGVVVPHRKSWPIPAPLNPYPASMVDARWALEGRKGGHPAIPKRSTIPLDEFGKRPAAAVQNKPVESEQSAATPIVGEHAPRAVSPRKTPDYEDAKDEFTSGGVFFGGPREYQRMQTVSNDLFGGPLDPSSVRTLIGAHSHMPDAGQYIIESKENELKVKARFGGRSTLNQEGTEIVRTYSRGPDGKLQVSHDMFDLAADLRNKGIGKKVLANQFEQYEKLGVERIATHAAWDGQYVWPRAGFELSDPRQIGTHKKEFANWMQKNHGVRAESVESMTAGVGTIHELSQIQLPATADTDPEMRKVGKRFLLERGNANSDVIALEVNRGTAGWATLKKYVGR